MKKREAVVKDVKWMNPVRSITAWWGGGEGIWIYHYEMAKKLINFDKLWTAI